MRVRGWGPSRLFGVVCLCCSLQVSASDISSAMANEAAARAKEVLGRDASRAKFFTSDLEELKGSFDTVTCVDVMIHYPTDKVNAASSSSLPL